MDFSCIHTHTETGSILFSGFIISMGLSICSAYDVDECTAIFHDKADFDVLVFL